MTGPAPGGACIGRFLPSAAVARLPEAGDGVWASGADAAGRAEGTWGGEDERIGHEWGAGIAWEGGVVPPEGSERPGEGRNDPKCAEWA